LPERYAEAASVPGSALPPSLSSGIRQSHMNLAHRCMRQLWFYLYRGPLKPNYFRLAGSSGHAAIEHYFRGKLEGSQDPPEEEVLDVFSAHFDQGLPECEKDGSNPYRLKDKISLETLPLFLRQEGVLIKPKLVEEFFRIELHEMEVPIVGTIDLFEVGGRLTDFKFRPGSRLPSQREIDRDFQLATYTFALEARGEKVKETAQQNLVCNPDRAARVAVIRSDPQAERIPQTSILDEYSGIVRFVERAKGDPEYFPMTDPKNWWCSTKWCGWSSMCPRFGGKH